MSDGPPRVDGLQEAVLEAMRVWPEHPPREPGAWLATVATEQGDDTSSALLLLPPRPHACLPGRTDPARGRRAKRTLEGRRLDRPGDLAVVLRVLYLVYTVGHGGRVDLAGEAVRLARQLTLATDEPEARRLLALMLLNRARLPARFDGQGRLVTLDRQDRRLWNSRETGPRLVRRPCRAHP